MRIAHCSKPQFDLIQTNNLTLDAGMTCQPLLADDDGDGDLDLWYSNVRWLTLFRNSGSAQVPQYSFFGNDMLNGIFPHAINLFDLDADGDLDLVSANGAYSMAKLHIMKRGHASISQLWLLVYARYTIHFG